MYILTGTRHSSILSLTEGSNEKRKHSTHAALPLATASGVVAFLRCLQLLLHYPLYQLDRLIGHNFAQPRSFIPTLLVPKALESRARLLKQRDCIY